MIYDLCGTMKNIFLAGDLKSAKYIQVWGVLFFQACSYSTHYCSSGFPPNDEELWINFHKLSGLSASRNPEAHGCVIVGSPQNPVSTLWCQPSLPFLVIVHLPKNADTQGHGFLCQHQELSPQPGKNAHIDKEITNTYIYMYIYIYISIYIYTHTIFRWSFKLWRL